jgi:hypothetical protein
VKLNARFSNVGRLAIPDDCSNISLTSALGIPWAADNQAFSMFDSLKFKRMLDTIWGLPGCRFVAAPDVVGDAAATLERWEEWYDDLNATLLPLALVAQDGLTTEMVPWRTLDAIFVGGTTEWKCGAAAEQIVREARVRGKWVHMGRVNTPDRFRYAKAIGCHSVDGSKFSRWTETWIRDGAGMAAAPPHLRMEVA